jgi:hypothetical protein
VKRPKEPSISKGERNKGQRENAPSGADQPQASPSRQASVARRQWKNLTEALSADALHDEVPIPAPQSVGRLRERLSRLTKRPVQGNAMGDRPFPSKLAVGRISGR